MLRIMKKEIDPEGSKVLFGEPVSEHCFGAHWKVHSGDWRVEGEWITGRNRENRPGMMFLRGDFPGDVLVDFEARTVPPSSHDINVMWNGSWDGMKNERGTAYVAGLEGWWEGKVGIEKSPEYKLTAGTPLFDFNPGRIYRIQTGSIGGHCFIFVDGGLALEMTDPDPIDSNRFTKVGFEAYCSHIQVRSVRVLAVAWRPIEMKYAAEF